MTTTFTIYLSGGSGLQLCMGQFQLFDELRREGFTDYVAWPIDHTLGKRHAGKAGEVFGQHRVALVRHRRGTLLPGREIFLRLQNFGALKVAD